MILDIILKIFKKILDFFISLKKIFVNSFFFIYTNMVVNIKGYDEYKKITEYKMFDENFFKKCFFAFYFFMQIMGLIWFFLFFFATIWYFIYMACWPIIEFLYECSQTPEGIEKCIIIAKSIYYCWAFGEDGFGWWWIWKHKITLIVTPFIVIRILKFCFDKFIFRDKSTWAQFREFCIPIFFFFIIFIIIWYIDDYVSHK